MRGFLALILTAGFFAALAALFHWSVPASNRDLVTYMLGQLSGFTGAAIAYYLGTSKSSSDKTDIIESMTRKD